MATIRERTDRQVSEMTITTRDGLLTIDGASVFPIFGARSPILNTESTSAPMCHG